MKRIFISAVLGTALLGGVSAASAHGLDDLFRVLPHPEHAFNRDDHDSHVRWHREARGFGHDAHYRAQHERRNEHRFESRRDESHRFGWHRHARDD
jgi:hypothetical protein